MEREDQQEKSVSKFSATFRAAVTQQNIKNQKVRLVLRTLHEIMSCSFNW